MARFEEAENRLFKIKICLNVTQETPQLQKHVENAVTRV